MKIFPAIDIKDGQCVRLIKGDYATAHKVAEDPLATARSFEAAGAEWIHMVDLDGAKDAALVNKDIFVRVAKETGLKVEVGGGIRTMKDADEALAVGVRRVILGSVAVRDPELVREACEKYGDRVVVGIDARDGIVAVDGWGVSGDIDAVTLARKMKGAGVKTVIYTDISRDGTLSGVNVEATKSLAEESGLMVVASGGVSSIDDIKALKKVESSGIEGVICGKSIYTGSLSLHDALEIARQ